MTKELEVADSLCKTQSAKVEAMKRTDEEQVLAYNKAATFHNELMVRASPDPAGAPAVPLLPEITSVLGDPTRSVSGTPRVTTPSRPRRTRPIRPTEATRPTKRAATYRTLQTALRDGRTKRTQSRRAPPLRPNRDDPAARWSSASASGPSRR